MEMDVMADVCSCNIHELQKSALHHRKHEGISFTATTMGISDLCNKPLGGQSGQSGARQEGGGKLTSNEERGCCLRVTFRWETISLDLMSQTLMSPATQQTTKCHSGLQRLPRHR
eukprot:745673-Hanusia_phi.AAC.2